MNPEDYTEEQQHESEFRYHQWKVLKHFMMTLRDTNELFTIEDFDGKEEIFSPADIYEAIAYFVNGIMSEQS